MQRIDWAGPTRPILVCPQSTPTLIHTAMHLKYWRAWVVAGLASGWYADAYNFATHLFDPEDSAYHPVVSSWLIGDLAEAALHLDRVEEARARVEQVEAAGKSPGSWIALGLDHARAVLADGSEAEQRFQAALSADFARWPFQRARTQLAYGQWLWRRRRTAESRDPLRAARDTFDALACASWSDKARRELRASRGIEPAPSTRRP